MPDILNTVIGALSDYGWYLVGLVLTAGYGVVAWLMIRKAVRDRRLPEDQKPGPRPMFYLGQAYLAFVWPVPLFLVLEALDVLVVPF